MLRLKFVALFYTRSASISAIKELVGSFRDTVGFKKHFWLYLKYVRVAIKLLGALT